VADRSRATFRRNASMILTDSLIFATWVLFWAYWLFSAIRDRSPYKKKQSRQSFLLSMIVLAVAWMLFTGLLSPGLLLERIVPDTPSFAAAGLIITVAGLGFAIWARIHLGKNWSGSPAIRSNQTIIRTGPYHFVRNPIYTGILLGVTGTALALGTLWALCTVVLLLVAFLLKIRVEEQFLTEEFGEEYLRYKREVRALIPFVI
jgi:protein-S-isoprenylcysteine O-methyltransferase Ste14